MFISLHVHFATELFMPTVLFYIFAKGIERAEGEKFEFARVSIG